MSSQYPPASQPGTPQPTPQPTPYGAPPQAPGPQAPAPQGTDPVAILGLVFAFLFWPLGLVLSIVGIARTGAGKRPGRGLAVAGAIISVLAGVLVVIAFALIGAFAEQASEDLDAATQQLEEDLAELDASAAAEPPADGEPADPAAAVAVGEPTTVADVTFTVTGEECGATTIGDEFLSTDAQGEFCLFTVTVENGSAEPLFFDSSSVTGFLGDAEYSADGEAAFYVEDNDAFLEDINPGNSVEATVVFDVPAGARLDRLELAPGLFATERAVVTLR